MVSRTDAVADVIADWVACNPDLIGRLARAHQLVISGAIVWDPDTRGHVVRSASSPDTWYRVSLRHRTCQCPDHVGAGAPRGWCKHLLALATIAAADRLLARRGLATATSEAAYEWRQLTGTAA
jgi:hypothetical protein